MQNNTAEIVVVTRPTELENLRRRFVTDQQVKFYLKQNKAQDLLKRRMAKARPSSSQQPVALTRGDWKLAEAAFQEVEAQAETYEQTLERFQHDLDFGLPLRFLDRSYLPNFDFGRCAVVVVVGQDGLVANTAKYVGELPIVAINPDPSQFDGVLLPFQIPQARQVVQKVLNQKARVRKVTLAETNLNDGQRMLAFNDIFIGLGGHASARYSLEINGQTESQSSSGILVSTGAGSSGWLSSVVNMARGVGQWLGHDGPDPLRLTWEERRLAWAVREPFISRQSRAELCAGYLNEGEELIVESNMASGGVIFSDGIESDYLAFDSGAIARVRVSQQRAHLVVG